MSNHDEIIQNVKDKRTILTELLKIAQHQEENIHSDIIAYKNKPDFIPVSFAQARLWLLYNFDRSSPYYNIALKITISGNLDKDALSSRYEKL